MLGIAPGNSSQTASQCKSSEFSSQFNSSMTDHVNMTSKLSSGMGAITGTINSIRKKIASIEQSAFNDLSKVASELFRIYMKIGNIFYIIIKNLINIAKIFKQTVNLGGSIAKMLIAFIDLLEIPVNGVINVISALTRM